MCIANDSRYLFSGGRDEGIPSRTMFLMSSLAVGGSERKTVRVVNDLVKRGWKMSVAYLSSPHTLRDQISPCVDTLYLDRNGKFDLRVIRGLAAYISKQKIEVVCCVNLYPMIYAHFVRTFYPYLRFRICVTINTTEFVRKKHEWQMKLYAPLIRRADLIIFGSAYQKNLWQRKYKLNTSRCSYIYNGVDTDYFSRSALTLPSQSNDIKAGLGIDDLCFVVGSVGRFRKEKQYEFVIQACVDLREKSNINLQCILVGGGYEEQKLKELVVSLNCQNYVHLIDTVDDVRAYLYATDVFVLSSISETFSNAVLEAMAMELPVILPDVGGCPEMVISGSTGFIYESGDSCAFARYIAMLAVDEGRRQKMGRAARKYVEDNYQFGSMVESYMHHFSNLL